MAADCHGPWPRRRLLACTHGRRAVYISIRVCTASSTSTNASRSCSAWGRARARFGRQMPHSQIHIVCESILHDDGARRKVCERTHASAAVRAQGEHYEVAGAVLRAMRRNALFGLLRDLAAGQHCKELLARRGAQLSGQQSAVPAAGRPAALHARVHRSTRCAAVARSILEGRGKWALEEQLQLGCL